MGYRSSRSPMHLFAISLLLAASLTFAAGGVIAQSPAGTVQSHVAAAKAAAGQEHLGLFNTVCAEPAPPAAPAQTQAPGPPDRSHWHAEPVKVFDNLYFVG